MRFSLVIALALASCATPTDSEPADSDSLPATSQTSVAPGTSSSAPTSSTSVLTATGSTGTASSTSTSTTLDTAPPPSVCDGRTIGTTVGTCAQDFTLTDASGATFTLSDYAGDVILLNFSAMWCGNCQGFAPELEQMRQTYAGQGLTVVSVLFQNTGTQEPTATDLQDWVDAFGLTYLVLGDVGQATYDAYDAGGQPTGIVIDRNFEIVWTDAGTPVRNHIEAQFTPLL